MDKKLEGRVAIITGAASGLGEASSRLFVEHGAGLVMTDINADRGHALAQEIGARFVETDVSDPAAVDRLVSDTVEREGQLDKDCALELAPYGVRVNALCPGAMFTGMTAGISEEQRRWLNNISPVGWAAQPIEMAKGALYLASDDAAYVSGHELVVDGASVAGFRYQ